jgi:hypothetical protein
VVREQEQVKIALPPRWWKSVGRRYPVEGYVCTVGSTRMVAHRSLMRPKRGDKRPRFSKTYWTITEPRSGHAVCEGSSQKTTSIVQAIEVAEGIVAKNGGAAAVERAVAAALSRQKRLAA